MNTQRRFSWPTGAQFVQKLKEYMKYELSEVAMKQYMTKKYGNEGYRLCQVIGSEIYYEIE